MKRLLKVCFDTTIFSFIPILSWFILGLLVDKNLINVFTLTYPFQFVWGMFKAVFGVGSNIYKEKHNDKNAVMSSIIVGIIIGFIVLLRYLKKVYSALQEKGYNPINQIVGYILSGDPTYITSYNDARNLIRQLDRDELLETLVRNYIGLDE